MIVQWVYISFTNSQSGLQDEDHDQVHLILDHLWSLSSLGVQLDHNQVFETQNGYSIPVYLLQRYCWI